MEDKEFEFLKYFEESVNSMVDKIIASSVLLFTLSITILSFSEMLGRLNKDKLIFSGRWFLFAISFLILYRLIRLFAINPIFIAYIKHK